MANKFSQLLTLGGIGFLTIANCIYLVDPGEKALIMNNLTGLKKQVFHQGYHLRIPFIEVTISPCRTPSSTMLDSNPSTSTSPQEQRTCRPSASRFVSCSNPSRRSFRTSTSCWARTTRRRSSIPSARKSSGPSLLNVPLPSSRRCRSTPQES